MKYRRDDLPPSLLCFRCLIFPSVQPRVLLQQRGAFIMGKLTKSSLAPRLGAWNARADMAEHTLALSCMPLHMCTLSPPLSSSASGVWSGRICGMIPGDRGDKSTHLHFNYLVTRTRILEVAISSRQTDNTRIRGCSLQLRVEHFDFELKRPSINLRLQYVETVTCRENQPIITFNASYRDL